MKVTQIVRKILAGYESDNPGTKGNLARILMHGRLGGTGKLVILPVDQGLSNSCPDKFQPEFHKHDITFLRRPHRTRGETA